MEYLTDPSTITIGLLIALILIIVWWWRDTPAVLGGQLPLLEETARRRGFIPLLGLIRNMRDGRDDRTTDDIQSLIVPLSQDPEFASQWLMPILKSNMHLIMSDRALFVQFDMMVRQEFGYRLKPIHHMQYGLRPETVLRATSDESEVCMREVQTTSLAVGQKTYVPLDGEEPVQTQEQ